MEQVNKFLSQQYSSNIRFCYICNKTRCSGLKSFTLCEVIYFTVFNSFLYERKVDHVVNRVNHSSTIGTTTSNQKII